jgi:hypothetical protein
VLSQKVVGLQMSNPDVFALAMHEPAVDGCSASWRKGQTVRLAPTARDNLVGLLCAVAVVYAGAFRAGTCTHSITKNVIIQGIPLKILLDLFIQSTSGEIAWIHFRQHVASQVVAGDAWCTM